MPATDVEAIAEASFPSTTTRSQCGCYSTCKRCARCAGIEVARCLVGPLLKSKSRLRCCAARMVHVVVPAKVCSGCLRVVQQASSRVQSVPSWSCLPASPLSEKMHSVIAVRYNRSHSTVLPPLPRVCGLHRASPGQSAAERHVSRSHVFSGCKSFTSISLPDGIGCIDDYVFAGCTALIAIAVPASVTCIGEGAFENCCALACINIPDSVDETGDNAFYNCPSLDADARERVYVVNGCAL